MSHLPEHVMAWETIRFVLGNLRSISHTNYRGDTIITVRPQNRDDILASLNLIQENVATILAALHSNYDGSIFSQYPDF